MHVKVPPDVEIGLFDMMSNHGGRVIAKVEPAYTGTEGVKLIVLVELTPVVSLELT